MSGRTDVWGALVWLENPDGSHLIETFNTRQRVLGETPVDGISLVEPLTITEGFDPLTYPGPPIPTTAQFTLHVRTGHPFPVADLGATASIVLKARPDLYPDWASSTTSGTAWVNKDLVVSDITATVVKDGYLLTYTCDDALALLAGEVVTAGDRPKESILNRWNAIFAGVTELRGEPLSVNSPNAVGDAGPLNVDGTGVADAAGSLLAGIEQEIGGPEGVHYLALDAGINTVYVGVLPKSSTDTITPYQLVMQGSEATTATRDVDTLAAERGRGMVLDACYVDRRSVSWSKRRTVNTIRMSTVRDDGQTGYVVASDRDVVARHGALTREVGTQAAHTNPTTAKAADNYLTQSDDAAASWRASTLTLRTDDIPAHLIEYYAAALQPADIATDPVGDLAVVNIGDDWKAPTDQIAGAVATSTYSITGGHLTIAYQLVPYVRVPSSTGTHTDAAATYQDLLDDPTLAAVRYQDSPPGSPHIDPAITYADMRLIGA